MSPAQQSVSNQDLTMCGICTELTWTAIFDGKKRLCWSSVNCFTECYANMIAQCYTQSKITQCTIYINYKHHRLASPVKPCTRRLFISSFDRSWFSLESNSSRLSFAEAISQNSSSTKQFNTELV